MATLFDTGIFSVIGLDSELLSGATIGWFVAGTTTPANSYTTNALSVANANPVPASAAARFPAMWLAPGSYKYVLKDASGNTLLTRDGFIAESAPPSFDPDLDDFLAGDEPLPIAKGGTASTSAGDAIVSLGGVPLTGGVSLTGQLGQSGKGPYLALAVGGLVGGLVWVTDDAAADPRTGNNQFWFKYPA